MGDFGFPGRFRKSFSPACRCARTHSHSFSLLVCFERDIHRRTGRVACCASNVVVSTLNSCTASDGGTHATRHPRPRSVPGVGRPIGVNSLPPAHLTGDRRFYRCCQTGARTSSRRRTRCPGPAREHERVSVAQAKPPRASSTIWPSDPPLVTGGAFPPDLNRLGEPAWVELEIQFHRSAICTHLAASLEPISSASIS